MTTELLYLTDAYLRDFDADVVAVDAQRGAVALGRTAFFPGGGGQPHDTGALNGSGAVLRVSRDPGGVVWHELAPGATLPAPGATVHGVLDWERRHLLMRTHTALHLLNGVIWLDHGAQVTGADMTPGAGRADFSLPAMSQEFGREVEARVNAQVALDLPIRIVFLPRAQADEDPSLIRSKANLIPRTIDPLRVVDVVGLDRQADSGTHVASTREVGTVRVTGTRSKGRDNKRVRIALAE